MKAFCKNFCNSFLLVAFVWWVSAAQELKEESLLLLRDADNLDCIAQITVKVLQEIWTVGIGEKVELCPASVQPVFSICATATHRHPCWSTQIGFVTITYKLLLKYLNLLSIHTLIIWLYFNMLLYEDAIQAKGQWI